MTTIDFISVIVLAKNEAVGIRMTLDRLRSFSDVVVVDSNSEDETVSIAESCGARVVNFTWDGQYPKKKQWAIDNSGVVNDWILLLDADEYPDARLLAELSNLRAELARAERGAYDITLRYRFAGRLLRHGHRVTKRSLLHRNVARFPVMNDLGAEGIREVEGHYQPECDRPLGHLSGRIIHDDRDPVTTWFERHNRYSDWEAYLRTTPEARREIAGRRTKKGQVFDRVPFKPLAFFLYSYVARLGFLDGRAGFDYAFALTSYYWQIGVKTRDLERTGSLR